MRLGLIALFTMVLLLVWTVQAVSQAGPRCYAILVGINTYEDKLSPSIPNLQYTHDDCMLFESVMPVLTGISADETTVELLTDTAATKDAVTAAFDRALAATTDGDSLVFYFSGHGSLVPDFDHDEPDGAGDGAMILPGFQLGSDPPDQTMVDGNTLTDDWMALQLEQFSHLGAVYFVADCCHSGGNAKDVFARDKGIAVPLPDSAETGLKTKAISLMTDANRVTQDNLVCIFASDSQTTAQELSGNGALTYCLAELLNQPGEHDPELDGMLDLANLHISLRNMVKDTVKKTTGAKEQASYVQWYGNNSWSIPASSTRAEVKDSPYRGVAEEKLSGLEDMIRQRSNGAYDTGDEPYQATQFDFVEMDGVTPREEGNRFLERETVDQHGLRKENLRARIVLDGDAFILPIVVDTNGNVFPLDIHTPTPFHRMYFRKAGEPLVLPDPQELPDVTLDITVDHPGWEYVVFVCSPVPIDNPYRDDNARKFIMLPLSLLKHHIEEEQPELLEKGLGNEILTSDVDGPSDEVIPGRKLTVIYHKYWISK